mgnify:FL=1
MSEQNDKKPQEETATTKASSEELAEETQVNEEISEETTDENESESAEVIAQRYQELNDKYLRAYSDFENTKKRLEKDKYNAIDYALEKFAKDLLEVIDNLTLAIKATKNTEASAEDILKNLTEGMDLTTKKFDKVLEKYDMTKIDSSGEFDPNLHNAINQVESSEHKTNEIVEVFQEGYKIKDRVLRASMVSIAQ